MPSPLLLSAALLAAAQSAEAPSSDAVAVEAAPAEARPGADCPSLFGADDDRAERKQLREASLEEVARGEVLLDIMHSSPTWQAPSLVRVPGVEVVEVSGLEEGAGPPSALVLVDDTWAEVCEPGEYKVGVDDALGSEGAVLAVVEEGLLAEHNGALVFLPKPGRRVPAVRMIWRSAFGLSVEAGKNGSLGGGGGGNPAAKRAADSKAKKARAKADAKAARQNRRATKAPRG